MYIYICVLFNDLIRRREHPSIVNKFIYIKVYINNLNQSINNDDYHHQLFVLLSMTMSMYIY